MEFRTFTPDDYSAVMELWRQSPEGIGLGRSDSLAELEKKLARDPDLFLVAENEGRIVGTVIGGFDGRRGLVYHLTVASPFRRHGLGTRLMQELERRLADKGCLRAYLLIKPENTETMAFYRRLGWQVPDVTLMAKSLDPAP